MKQIAVLTLALGLTVAPAIAQEQSETEVDDGFSLMEEGARMLMRGLMAEMEPAIDELRDSFEEMGPAFAEFARSVGPAFAELLNQVDDFRNYEPPEFMPNGDIIIRRKPAAPLWEPDPETGEIEL
ncbi:MAG: AAA+ family ATPase [Yoonia sp.]|uniref:AAA+ family ATPase n=1 Tax=Yoonia sp. TaxID=2212373 RepID=UPI00273EF792|nr:AAA+ family ATPase [Yoonia sp.]MDP5084723.1 AAA+ family ATPase [Yoonia sp.]MDP5361523.1 AAA+ family ATPase [Paracoccaceae bacterium]